LLNKKLPQVGGYLSKKTQALATVRTQLAGLQKKAPGVPGLAADRVPHRVAPEGKSGGTGVSRGPFRDTSNSGCRKPTNPAPAELSRTPSSAQVSFKTTIPNNPVQNDFLSVRFFTVLRDWSWEATRMMVPQDPETDQLLHGAGLGDPEARQQFLVRHQERLRKMIALRMDRRLAARLDPLDVVQETLAEAVQKLSDYLRHRPLPFYPWLRQLAWEKLVELHRRHVQAQKRSVRREERWAPPLPDESALELAGRLFARGSSPSARLRRHELRGRLQAALAQLAEHDREVLVLRHLEQLSTQEIAAVLGVSHGAVYTRHLRALERLRRLLGDEFGEDEP
jgi:RNA polymerase sigma-70 factor (ECF subfamily)